LEPARSAARVGARLARDGREVLLCDADAEHVAAINERGLAIEGPVEEFTVWFQRRCPTICRSAWSG